MKKTFLFCLTAVAMLWTACEKSFSYEGVIRNDSGKNIKFYFYNTSKVLTDSFAINTGSSKTVGNGTIEGVKKDFDCASRSMSRYGDSVRTVVVGGGTLKKKVQKSENWKTEDVEKNLERCTFSISATDI